MSTIEQKIKDMIGELSFQLMVLEVKLEKLQAENETLKKQLEKSKEEKPE